MVHCHNRTILGKFRIIYFNLKMFNSLEIEKNIKQIIFMNNDLMRIIISRVYISLLSTYTKNVIVVIILFEDTKKYCSISKILIIFKLIT